MLNCSDWEELNARFRIAMLRHRRFLDMVAGLERTERNEREAAELEEEMNEAERMLARHQKEHGCRG